VTFKKGDSTHQKKPRKRPSPPPDFVPGGVNPKKGRPPTYRPSYDEAARRLRLLMLTQAEIAQYFGVSPKTIDLWCRTHPSFNTAYAEGGEIIDAEVAVALRHRAVGYSHPAEKIMVVGGSIVREEYTQHYPPDTAAAALWLSNRQRGRWKLGNNVETPDAGVTINVTGGLPDE
jgi:hypothetical protein